MEQDYFVFDEETKQKKTIEEATKQWELWLLLKGFNKLAADYYEKNIFEENRATCRIVAFLIHGSMYEFNFHLTQWCLTYTDSYKGLEVEGGQKTIESVANGMKEYLELRDEVMQLKKDGWK